MNNPEIIKALFIINPKSGAKNKEQFRDWIQKGVDTSRYDFEIVYTGYPGHATALARQASEKGYQLVVAVGGDGSVNETGAGLSGSTTVLGIIPAGSGNGMARHLKIPVDFKMAVESLNNCRYEAVDTMRINGRFCIGTFGTGFDAHVAHLFAKAGKRGYTTYVKLVLSEFYRYKPNEFRLTVDGQEKAMECFLLTFANSSQFGNNAVIAPFADVHDGLIEISRMKKFPLFVAPGLIYRMMNNSLHKSRYFEGFRGKNIIIHREGSTIGHIDGEPVEFSGDIRIEIIPASLRMAVPSA